MTVEDVAVGTEMDKDQHTTAEDLFAEWAADAGSGHALEFERFASNHAECEQALRALHADWRQYAPILEKLLPGAISDCSSPIIPLASRAGNENPTESDAALMARLGVHAPHAERYRFRAVLGRGGGGVVLKVWDTKLSRSVAMKVVLGRFAPASNSETPAVNARRLTRFVDEARIASQLNHPGIVPVHELGADGLGRVFFTMRLVNGDDLSSVFGKVRRHVDSWTTVRAVGVLARVCETMAYAHDRGVIHRDLKPANIMVGRYGEVHVMDWGLARVLSKLPPARSTPNEGSIQSTRDSKSDSLLQHALTLHGDALGTPKYMAPEQARGDLDNVGPAADIYSVGAILYHLLAGVPPYSQGPATVSALEVVERVKDGPPTPLAELQSDIPAELAAICDKAMRRDPSLRYDSMDALGSDLRAYLESRVVAAFENGSWAMARKWLRRNKALAGSLGAAACAVLLGLGGVAFVQAEARHKAESMAEANKQLAGRARDSARDAEREAAHAATLTREALAREREARWQLYLSSIHRAESAIKTCQIDIARRALATAPLEHRKWEWQYLNAQLDDSSIVLPSGDGWVVGTAWLEATPLALVSDHNCAMRVVDVTSGAVLAAMPLPDELVCATALVGKLARVATYSQGGRLSVWDIYSGSCIASTLLPDLYVFGIQFSSLGECLLLNGPGEQCRLWRYEESALVSLVGHTQTTRCAELSPDHMRVLTTGDDQTVRVWDAFTGSPLFTLNLGEAGQSCHWSPDSAFFLAETQHGISVWDATTAGKRCNIPFRGFQLAAHAVFSPDAALIAFVQDDGSADVYNVMNGGKRAHLLQDGEWIESLCFDSTSSAIATSSRGGVIRLWDACSSEVRQTLRGSVARSRQMRFRGDNRSLLSLDGAGEARLWNLDDEEPRHTARERRGGVFADDGFPCPYRSPDRTRYVSTSENGSACLYDFATGLPIAVLAHRAAVERVSFGIHSQRVGVVFSDGRTAVFDSNDGSLIADVKVPQVEQVELSADGGTALVATHRMSVFLCETASGQVVAQLPNEGSLPPRFCFSPSGDVFATVSLYNRVQVWDSRTGAYLHDLRCENDRVHVVSFSPDGSRCVAWSDETFTGSMCDVATGNRMCELHGHADVVFQVGFDSTGRRLISASRDGTARIWDTATGEELLTIPTGTDSAYLAEFGNDGYCVRVAGPNGLPTVIDCRARTAQHAAIALERDDDLRARAYLADLASAIPDWIAVVEHLDGDRTLDESVRRLARRLVPELADGDVRAARYWIDELRNAGAGKTMCVEKISDDATHTQLVRSTAIRLCSVIPE